MKFETQMQNDIPMMNEWSKLKPKEKNNMAAICI